MSWWSRFKSRRSSSEAPEPKPEPKPKPEPRAPARAARESEEPQSPLEPLLALARGDAVNPGAAQSALSLVSGTMDEKPALDAVLRAHEKDNAPEELCTAGARLLALRGEGERALSLLSGAKSPEALMMAADFHADRGQIALSITLLERVLARDLDIPGARERRERLLSKLGGNAAHASAASAGATVLRSDAPETSLRIIGEAGRGGAGSVYEAIDDVLGRRVALKVYHRPADDHDKLANEARMAVELGGPGVVRVFDADLDRGFIVMEWLPGAALKHWLAEPQNLLPLERWVLPFGQALSRIHAANVVHADIKPANVMFRAFDEPILSDFGLARHSGQPLFGGSLGYMSPERLAGASATFAEDVYAFGRIIEDVLSAAGEPSAAWSRVVHQLLAPVESRPVDARAVLDVLAREILLDSKAGAPILLFVILASE